MNLTHCLLSVGALAFFTGCSGRGKIDDFLGPEIVKILEAPDRVESFRIDGSLAARMTPEAEGTHPVMPRVSDYPLISTGPDLSADQIEDFRALVLDPNNWDFYVAKACTFSPGVALRFTHGADEFVALLCFSCDEWGFERSGVLHVEDSDNARDDLLELARDLFPGDSLIRALK